MSEDSKVMISDQFAEVYARAWNDAIDHPKRYGDIFDGYETDHQKALALIAWQGARLEDLSKQLGILQNICAQVCPASPRKKLMISCEEHNKDLFALKREVHGKAIYAHNSRIDPYISLKVFDALLTRFVKDEYGGDV